MGVDYTPTMKPYEKVGAFRYWCQTTLPLVYDDSKSYLELLYSVIHYLNSTISDVANMGDNIDALLEAYNQLQKYVNDYFDNLDVQSEIDAKLDEMASDGSLSELLEPFIPNLVSAWLAENLTPTTPPIDKTLTIEGAGADAKTVGEKIGGKYIDPTWFTDNSITSFVDVPFGTYMTLVETAGRYGFSEELGASFVMFVTRKAYGNYAYKTFVCYGNNGTAMYAVCGGSTSPTNPPAWHRLTELIDASLTVSGAGADAKTVGEKIGGRYIDADWFTRNAITSFVDIPYGVYMVLIGTAGSYDFSTSLGRSFAMFVTNKAYGNYTYKTFVCYGNNGTAMYAVCGGNTTAGNPPAWHRLTELIDNTLSVSGASADAKTVGDKVGGVYADAAWFTAHSISTFIDVPYGTYLVQIETPGRYGFDTELGASFSMWVTNKGTGNYAYKTFVCYGNNGTALYAVCGGSTSSSNLPAWHRLTTRTDTTLTLSGSPADAQTVGEKIGGRYIDPTWFTNNSITAFIDVPYGTYMTLVETPGNYGFDTALGASFVMWVTSKAYGNYAYKTFVCYANNGVAMYAVCGGSTSAANLPVWHRLDTDAYLREQLTYFDVPTASVKLLLLGDSITQGAGAAGLGDGTPFTTSLGTKMIWGTGNSWALKLKEYLAEQYSNIEVINHGWGGITWNQLAQYISEFVPEGITHCIIGLGVNSGGATSFDTPIRTVIQYLRSRGIKVYAWSSWLGTHPNLQNINTAGKIQAANMHGYNLMNQPCIPVYSIAKRYIDDNNIAFMDVMEYQPDDEIVHPNDLGHEILFRIIREGVGL